jgi:hypothetical protein
MPGLLQYKSNIGVSHIDAEHPEDAELWFPSKLPDEARHQVCALDLPSIEDKLRTAQCYDALESIRHTLKIKSRLIKFKNKNLRGQREGLRSRAIIDRVHEKARAAAAKYRSARAAKFMLLGPGGWENDLRVLVDADIRAYQDPNPSPKKRGRQGTIEDDHVASNTEYDFEDAIETEDFSLLPENRDRRDGTGETRRTLSWIWLTAATNPEEGDDILQIEWAKSRARAARAAEEILLLKEEMRRVIEFLRWKSEWWMSRVGERLPTEDLTEGLRAYACKQSLLQKRLAEHFQSIWMGPLQDSSIDNESDEEDGADEGDGEAACNDYNMDM